MVDEDFQSGHRPMSQPFQVFQAVSWAQPSPPMDFTTNNQLSRFTDCAAQDLTFEDFENITSAGAGEFDTTMLSSGLQQSLFRPLIAPQTCSLVMNTLCSEKGPSSFMGPTDNQPQHPLRVVHRAARKRAPKAPTISPKKWEPAEGRIRQLFVDEERTYKDVMATVNKDERQYKAKILQMKLKRNVEAAKRTALIRHIQYRKDTLKKATKYVRVHGHRKPQAMVQQWMKEYPMTKWPTPYPPPSPLPSQISLRTRSRLASPTSSVLTVFNRNIPGTQSAVATSPVMDTPIKRLLSHAHEPNMVIKSEQCGAILNDFQKILSAGHDIPKCAWHDMWSPEFEEFLVTIRNWMNLTRKIWLGKETQAIFEQLQPSSEHNSVQEELSIQRPITAQIVIHPNSSCVPPYRIVLDLDPHLNPSARITYQAIIPNSSEVFHIIEYGELEDLLRAFDNKTASLTDRDEEVDFVRFLLKNGFDPNAIECDGGDGNLSLKEDDSFHNASECCRLMLETGADFEMRGEEISNFEWILVSESSTLLKHVIQYGRPFLHPYIQWYQFWPLLKLADYSGYGYCESFHVLEKAIILLKWGAEISCKDSEGSTVLHKVLRSYRRRPANRSRSEKEPVELLEVFIAAGADVYALNKSGYSASRTAREYGREEEWSEALEFCGFDFKEVMNRTMPKHKQYTGPRQTPKSAFEEYYRQWDENKWDEKMTRLEKVDIKEVENREEKCNNQFEDISDESECWCEDDGEDEHRLEGQLKCYCTPEAATVASRNTDGDGNDRIDDLVDDHYDLGHAHHAEHGNETGEDMLMAQTDHVSSMDQGIAITFEGTDHDGNNTLRTATRHLYDPMLNDEAESTTGSWRCGAMDYRRNLDQTSLAEGDYFEEMEAVLEDPFQTEFDAFMASD
ncbi:hypothetical protein G7Y89_g909 [Cudoniella acicularis]|uniref:Uncharacterized protein n=1 Tax=Cudoniella acicularis TaxID=354080 RepID=A0A8H4RXA4_9HELO|nr:hypothetical protein G7Y89_g909 [Cudoniella acicularis]